MNDVAVIVLAAGNSSRMGARNKLLINLEGDMILRRVLRAVSPVSNYPVTLVTGHEQLGVLCALGREPVNFVHNPLYASGQLTSVMAGLRDAPMAETTLLALGDQPFLTAAAVDDLLSAHQKDGGHRITIPFVDGRRGNPIVIPRALRTRMLDDPLNLGCHNLTRTHPERVHRFDTHHRGFIEDIDTPQDLVRALSRPLLET